MTREEKAQEFARNCAEYNNLPIEVEHLIHTAFIVGYNEKEDEEKNPWHKAADGDLPKEGQHILYARKTPYNFFYDTIYYPEPLLTDEIDYWMEIPEIEEN